MHQGACRSVQQPCITLRLVLLLLLLLLLFCGWLLDAASCCLLALLLLLSCACSCCAGVRDNSPQRRFLAECLEFDGGAGMVQACS